MPSVAAATPPHQLTTSQADLTGRVALVTGGRVKIGFHIAIKLLRCGATVVRRRSRPSAPPIASNWRNQVVQTRFANDAVRRFGREPDFAEWKHRLRVYGVDFRDVGSVHRFAAAVQRDYDRLDILINNAAQTVPLPRPLRTTSQPAETNVRCARCGSRLLFTLI